VVLIAKEEAVDGICGFGKSFDTVPRVYCGGRYDM